MSSNFSPLPATSTEPFWRTQLDEFDNHRTTEVLPEVADIVIIGAGIAGASTAYHLLEKSGVHKPSIVILEERGTCSGATGRNGGHVKPDLYGMPASLLADFGLEAATEVLEFEESHVQAMKEVIEKENIECDFVVTTAMDVQLSEPIRDKLKAGYDRLIDSGVLATKKVVFTSGEQAEALSSVKGANGCFSYATGTIWPYKFVLHLLKKAVRQGVNLQTYTPVHKVSETRDSNDRWTISTSRGDIKAKTIVYATNGYTSRILPEYEDSIIPSKGICCRIVPTQTPAPYLRNSYVLRWGPSEFEYLIPRADGSIIVGGARSAYFSQLETWYDTTDDSTLIEPAKDYFDGYMQRCFRGWEDSGAHVESIWTGIMGYSTDGMPHIGHVPSKPNQFILAGFNGHGMPLIFLSARGIASMILEQKSFADSGVPRVFETSQKRLDSKKNAILEGWKAFQTQ